MDLLVLAEEMLVIVLGGLFFSALIDIILDGMGGVKVPMLLFDFFICSSSLIVFTVFSRVSSMIYGFYTEACDTLIDESNSLDLD